MNGWYIRKYLSSCLCRRRDRDERTGIRRRTPPAAHSADPGVDGDTYGACMYVGTVNMHTSHSLHTCIHTSLMHTRAASIIVCVLPLDILLSALTDIAERGNTVTIYICMYILHDSARRRHPGALSPARGPSWASVLCGHAVIRAVSGWVHARVS